MRKCAQRDKAIYEKNLKYYINANKLCKMLHAAVAVKFIDTLALTAAAAVVKQTDGAHTHVYIKNM